MQKINFKFLLVVILFLFPLLAKAASLEELKKQFISLGGSDEGFNKIIQVVEKSQKDNKKLKDKIYEIYNKQFFDLMTSNTFDYQSYIQVYNNLEKEKHNLTAQNLNDMISLLNSLSLNDRKAYASLLYNISNAEDITEDINKDNLNTQSKPSANNSSSSNQSTHQPPTNTKPTIKEEILNQDNNDKKNDKKNDYMLNNTPNNDTEYNS